MSQAADVGAPVQRRRPLLSRALPYLLSLPALVVCVGILVPFGTAVYYSLERYNLALPFSRRFIWFGNYVSLFKAPDFWNTVRVSMVYTVSTVGVELLLGLGIALLLRERTRLNNVISIALLLPLMTAPAIAALMWKLMTNPGFGVLSWALSVVGIDDFRWASAPSSAMFTVVLVDVWVYTPFMIILLLAGLRSLPPAPFEAARLDGVSRQLRVSFRITLPMLTPFLLTAILFRLLDSIQQFRHHLRDDAGRTRRQSPGVPGARLSRLLSIYQCRPVGCRADGALADHLRIVERVRQTMA